MDKGHSSRTTQKEDHIEELPGGAQHDPRTSDETEVPPSPMPEFPRRDDYPMVPDPAFPNRMVSTKQANRPFLKYVLFGFAVRPPLTVQRVAIGVPSYSEYRTKREAEHAAWLERKNERTERLARGEVAGPEEPDPTEEPEVGCLGLLKFVLYVAVFALLAGKFITGSFLWEHELPNFKKWIPVRRPCLLYFPGGPLLPSCVSPSPSPLPPRASRMSIAHERSSSPADQSAALLRTHAHDV